MNQLKDSRWNICQFILCSGELILRLPPICAISMILSRHFKSVSRASLWQTLSPDQVHTSCVFVMVWSTPLPQYIRFMLFQGVMISGLSTSWRLNLNQARWHPCWLFSLIVARMTLPLHYETLLYDVVERRIVVLVFFLLTSILDDCNGFSNKSVLLSWVTRLANEERYDSRYLPMSWVCRCPKVLVQSRGHGLDIRVCR